MIVLQALAIGVLFGAGVLLMQGRDLIRMVAGAILVSNAVNLLIMTAGLSRGAAPIHPLPDGRPVSDPLVEALALTATVITFGLTSFLPVLVYRVYAAHESVEAPELARGEDEDARELDDVAEPTAARGQSR
jgi:multicomponent Na+:H+ antiporter subunit C